MMIILTKEPCVISQGQLYTHEASLAKGFDCQELRQNTLAAQILSSHNVSSNPKQLQIRFDALASHDITYVGIIQTARASGLKEFHLPYVLTNCHNSLCAVGGTINEDDHVFGLSAAQKYGGIFVPTNLAVIHQYVREQLVHCGGMILGSDSHTRYGALGCMGFGEGGPELVKQLLNKTYDVPSPEVIAIWLTGQPQPGVGPQDVALALIQAVFKSGFVKNKILEFHGPGIANLSVEFRSGIDVMTTETTCLSSIWETDSLVESYYNKYQRADKFKPLTLNAPAAFDGLIQIELDKIVPMIALPFHPSNAYPIKEFLSHAKDLLQEVQENCTKQYGELGQKIDLQQKLHAGHFHVDQGIIAGCAGGNYENIAIAAEILHSQSVGNNNFSLSLYPASQPLAQNLVEAGAYSKLLAAGAILKTCFCGPCFGAGDTPANGAFSIRHSTRNFPNREGSKPANGQLSLVALMDARSIAATAANQGRLTPATDLDWEKIAQIKELSPSLASYKNRIYHGFGHPQPQSELVFGPNITDWPQMHSLPKHLILHLAAIIKDPVTTTDELIPSGETSSLRSNPLKLAEFTLSRKEPAYVERAKKFQQLETARSNDPNSKEAKEYLNKLAQKLPKDQRAIIENLPSLDQIGFGTTIFANKPGDGSAREQAASCQKVLGGWANLAIEYATKRYRSNLINWGMLPILIDANAASKLTLESDLFIFNIQDAIMNNLPEIDGYLCTDASQAVKITLKLSALTDDERKIILAGCLINYYRETL